MTPEDLPRSSLPLTVLEPMQAGIMGHAYRGIDCYKCPMDLAIYQRILWEAKPRTVIEIGTAKGGSALWLADQLTTYAVEGFEVHSYDIGTPPAWRDHRITFHQGDAFDLPQRMHASWMTDRPRPLLVIEDSAHTSSVTTAVLDHFAPLMHAEEYLIVEDAIIHELGADDLYDGGPRRALAAFLDSHPEFTIDERWCNYYGRNVTWNVNGYLRRRPAKDSVGGKAAG
jgi:cephalosporin hydroxylase